MKRKKLKKSYSKKLFKATGSKTHKKNLRASVTRGGYRI